MIGIGETAVIIGAVVLIFGATRIPKLARSLGEGLKEFKNAVNEAKTDETEDADGDETKNSNE